eukprot:COSAG06_NODE_70882_length_189_cov_59.633333_1_plen_21_part_10
MKNGWGINLISRSNCQDALSN